MTTYGSLGLLSLALITTLIILAATAGSVVISNQTTSKETLEQVTTEVTNDLTSYIKVQQIIGKFATGTPHPGLQQLAINIRPLVTGTIDLSQMKIELLTPNDLTLFSYQNASPLSSGPLFSNKAWSQLTPGNFSMLVTIDDDASIVTAHTLNKNTDTGFLIVKLPDTLQLFPGETYQLTLMPTPGQSRQFTLDIPMSTTAPVTLYP